MNQTEFTTRMFIGRMRVLRQRLMQSSTFSKWTVPSLLRTWIKTPLDQIQTGQSFQRDGSHYMVEQEFDPRASEIVYDPREVMLWRNAAGPAEQRQPHDVLMKNIGLLAA